MGDKALEDITRLVKKYGDSTYEQGFKDGFEKGSKQ